jgi:hypothetical protein
MKKFMCVCFLALLSISGTVRAEEAKKSILTTVFGEKPEHWVELGAGFGMGSNAASEFHFSSPAMQAAIEHYLKVNNVTPLGAMADLGVNITSKISLNVDHLFSPAQQSIDIYGSSPSKTGTMNVDSSPIVSLHYAPVKFWGIKPYLGMGVRKLGLSGPQGYVDATKIESGEMNTLLEVGLKFPIYERVLGSLDYRRSNPVTLDTDMTFAHLKTTLGSDLVSASVHIALF